MNIQILGDLHGHLPGHLELLPAHLRLGKKHFDVKAAIQVGDFGFFKGVTSRLQKLTLPVPLHVIDGNHEDHRFLALLTAQKMTTFGFKNQIIYHGRADVFELGSVTIGCLGGALHAEHDQESENNPNWVTDPDADRAAEIFNDLRPQVIISHSCPHSIGIGMKANPNMALGVARFCRSNGFDTGPATDCGEPGLTRLWQRLTYRPRLWIFGHFHRFHRAEVDRCRFVCVGSSDGTDNQDTPLPIILDAEALTITRGRRTHDRAS